MLTQCWFKTKKYTKIKFGDQSKNNTHTGINKRNKKK